MAHEEQPARPILRLVAENPDPVSSRPLLDLPQTLRARSPITGDFGRVRVSRADLTKQVMNGRRTPAVEFATLLAHKIPLVPMREDEPREPLMSLSDAHACFIGINRPLGLEDNGANVAVYVLKPSHTWRYDSRPPIFSAVRAPVPSGVLFAAYVVLDVGAQPSPTFGALTHWGFVGADASRPEWPADYGRRYQDQCW